MLIRQDFYVETASWCQEFYCGKAVEFFMHEWRNYCWKYIVCASLLFLISDATILLNLSQPNVNADAETIWNDIEIIITFPLVLLVTWWVHVGVAALLPIFAMN